MPGIPLSPQDLPHNGTENSLHLSPVLDLLCPVFLVFLLLSFSLNIMEYFLCLLLEKGYIESKLVEILSEIALFYTDP